MAQKGWSNTLGLSSFPQQPQQQRYQLVLPTLLFYIDGLPHIFSGPVCILFSRQAAELMGLPERLVQGFLLVYTAYGAAVVLGLRGVDWKRTSSSSSSSSRSSGSDNDNKKKKKLVPRWLTALAIGANLAFTAFMSFSLWYFDRDLTAVGRWSLRGLLGIGSVVSSVISWAVAKHYGGEKQD